MANWIKRPVESAEEMLKDARGNFEDASAALANFLSGREEEFDTALKTEFSEKERKAASTNRFGKDLQARVDYLRAVAYSAARHLQYYTAFSDWIKAGGKVTDTHHPFDDFAKEVGITREEYTGKISEKLNTEEFEGISDIDVGEGVVLTSTGFISSSEAAATEAFKAAKEETGAVGRTGETLTINRIPALNKDEKDTFEVIGEDTGTVYGQGESLAEALALQTQLQSGSTPSVSGRPDLFAIEPTLPEEIAAVEAGTARVATLDELEQARLGTLPTLEAEQAAKAAATATAAADASTSISSALESSVSALESAALEADPSLVITDEMRDAWLQEAWDEIKSNKYYAETIRLAELDIGTSIDRLIEDTRAREAALVKQYGTALTATQESLQARGLLYGGVRTGEERELAEEANVALSAEDIAMKRGLEDITAGAERYLGSERAEELAPTYGTTQEVGRVLAGTPTFEAGETIDTFAPIGDIYGSLAREQEEEARYRAGEKETVFREITSEYA